MPTFRRRTSRRKPRAIRRRRPMRRKRSQLVQVRRQMPGFPSNRVYRFRYVASISLNPGIGALALYQFRANSLFDPDFTALLGGQPLGFDEMTVFWNNYKVIGSKVSCSFSISATDANYGPNLAVGCYVSDDTSVPATFSSMAEQGISRWKYISQAQTRGRDAVSVTNRFSAKKFFHLTDIKDNFQIGARTNANPSQLAYFNVWAGSIDDSVDPPAMRCVVIIDYLAYMSEPRSLNQS